jgi:spermidine synthase
MKPHRLLASATTPDGAILTLHAHDRDFMLRFNGAELMSTRQTQSERRLAEVACERLADASAPQVLIGGLGLGFTLKATLDLLPPDATVVVAEIVPEVIDWNRNTEYGFGCAGLADPRVVLRRADVGEVIGEAPDAYDAIMLDVDNGAEALTTLANTALYRDQGIRLAMKALRPGGRIAYWSAVEDESFAYALEGAGLQVTVEQVRAHPSSRRVHHLFIGTLRRGRR